jgi:hypothetical protein
LPEEFVKLRGNPGAWWKLTLDLAYCVGNTAASSCMSNAPAIGIENKKVGADVDAKLKALDGTESGADVNHRFVAYKEAAYSVLINKNVCVGPARRPVIQNISESIVIISLHR